MYWLTDFFLTYSNLLLNKRVHFDLIFRANEQDANQTQTHLLTELMFLYKTLGEISQDWRRLLSIQHTDPERKTEADVNADCALQSLFSFV